MTQITYGIVKEIYSLGQKSRVSYGIVAYSMSDEENTSTVIASVHDLTSDKNSIEKLVLLCNCLQVSTVHLNDVVEDYFAV